jgi:hypothetical protein
VAGGDGKIFHDGAAQRRDLNAKALFDRHKVGRDVGAQRTHLGTDIGDFGTQPLDLVVEAHEILLCRLFGAHLAPQPQNKAFRFDHCMIPSASSGAYTPFAFRRK